MGALLMQACVALRAKSSTDDDIGSEHHIAPLKQVPQRASRQASELNTYGLRLSDTRESDWLGMRGAEPRA
jgi:hypothetical protein